MFWLQRAIRWFLPDEGHFFDHIDAAVDAAIDAAKHVVRLTEVPPEQRAAEVAAIEAAENRGDDALAAMGDELDRTFVTPIDREDLYHLAVAIEAVSDHVASAAARIGHGMATIPEGSREIADLLVRANEKLSEAARGLRRRDNPDAIRAAVREVKRLEHEADDVFHGRMRALFATESNAIRLIEHKEFLEALESAVDATTKAATLVDGVLLKNG
jgi:uncharacterized protein Yka (UPF0111/DUF47 family)